MNKRVDVRDAESYWWPMLLMLGLFFFGACASTHRERMLEEVADAPEADMQSEALEAQFTAERLSAEELTAFESRAVQKLEDFSDYVNLLADPDLDSVFRQQAIRQAISLFVNEQAEVMMGTQKEEIRDFLQYIESDKQSFAGYVLQNISVKNPLQPNTDRAYSGILTFQQFLPEHNKTASRKAYVLVRKVPKSFGDQQEWVWEVLIEGIE